MRFATLALLFLVPACGEMPLPSDDAGPTPDAEVPDAGPAPDAEVPDAGPTPDAMVEPDAPTMPEIDTSTPEGFCEAYATIQCAAWEVCGECDAPTATCVATMTERCVEPTVAYPGTYHAEDADAFLGLLEDTYAECEQPSEMEHYTFWPWHGEQENGTECTSASQCQSGYCTALNVGDRWTCFVPDRNFRMALCR